MDPAVNGKQSGVGIKKAFGVTNVRKALDASGSFHQSINGSFANLSISLNKTPNPRNGKGDKKLNKSGSRLAKTPVVDRFVPDRSNFEMAHYLLQSATDAANRNGKGQSDASGDGNNSDNKKNNSLYSKSLTENMLGVSDLNSVRVLSFAQRPKGPPEGYQNALKVVYQGSATTTQNTASKYRVYPKSPDRVLDAPDVVDDFYLNLLDWSSSNVVSIALRDQVYLWTAHSAEIQRVPCDSSTDDLLYVSSLGWLQDGSHLVCATDNGRMQIWDVERVKMIRNLRTDDSERIAAMSFRSHMLTEGNRLGTLRHHDLRVAEHEVMKRENAHAQEICGVRWSPDGRFCSTGGNDNLVNIWDSVNMSSTSQPVCTFSDHQAAIKAMCWSPSHSNVLATGGGTNDRCIKLWNVSSGTLLKSVNAESQVSSLIWSEAYREILSSHGFTKHQLTLWKYPEMSKVGEMMGHTGRILQMALSPDQTTVATVGADETLRFWRIFPPSKTSKDLKPGKPKASVMAGFHGVR
ncbi:unnamed protein product [Orchesella dallaii]|uniref:CDC20/Fizzy WD40 domain-containing protein n=1 Tax=Orchesella dallaii TaxID=48710 RepID=A0ABP1PRM6_9HEXA